MTVEKQDANFVGMSIARETTLKVLPDPATFYVREPNSFKDLGGDFKSVSRRVFNPSRQRKKGSVVDLNADGGWNEDVTQNNMFNVFDAFFFAALRKKGNQSNVAATVTTNKYTVASSTNFLVNSLILAKNFTLAANNGLKAVTAIPDATHVTAGVLATEAAGAAKSIEVVGYQFPAADASIAVVGGTAVLTSAAIVMTTLGLIPGEWVFVGGDGAGTYFAGVSQFYGRVKEVTATTIVFDKTTAAVVTDAGTGKTIQIFFGTVVKNEFDPDLIVRYTHAVERTLGRDADGVQSEVLPGFVYNELTWNSPLADKVNVDISGVAMSHTKRTGAQGPLSGAGANVKVAGLGEDAYNTSSNIYRLRMSILDAATLNPTPLFARVTEWNMKINNNVSPNKAQGTLGAFDTTAGTFDVDGDFTVYFSTMAAIQSIEDNADVTFDAIYSKDNAAMIMDVPLLGTGGGKLKVEMDAAIMMPLKIMGAESPFGHTALFNWLAYVPSVGMATGA